MPANEEIQQTFIMLKPDAIERGLVGEIISRFEQVGLKLLRMETKKLSKETVARHYKSLMQKPSARPIRRSRKKARSAAISGATARKTSSTRPIRRKRRGLKSPISSAKSRKPSIATLKNDRTLRKESVVFFY